MIPSSVYPKTVRRVPPKLGFSLYSLRFNGINNYMQVPYDPSLDPNYITIGQWIKIRAPPPVGTYTTIISKGTWLFARIWPNQTYDFPVRIGGVWINVWGSTILSADVCYYLVAVYDGIDLRVYLNNVLDCAPVAAPGVLDNMVANLLVGVPTIPPFADNAYYEGIADELHVYNRALTTYERGYNMLNYHNIIRDGLVLWHRMEEGTGLVAYDGSGYGNNGSLLPVLTPPIWRRNKMWELRNEAGL